MSDETRSAYSLDDIPNPRYTKHADGSSTPQVEIAGGGSGGGPATIADGADVAQGATTDPAVTDPALAATEIALLKGTITDLNLLLANFATLLSRLPAAIGQANLAASFPVAIASNQSAVPVGDGGGSLTTDTPQLPATLGQQARAASLPVTLDADLFVSAATTAVQAIGTTDAAGYGWVSVHITAQGTNSLVTFQASNDNVNWRSVALQDSTSAQAAPQTSTGSSVLLHGPLPGRYFRLNVTGISAGTTSAVIGFSALAHTLQSVGVGANITLVNGQTPTAADGRSGSALLGVSNELYNGNTFDPMRANNEATVLASAARTASTNSSDQTNYNARGVVITIDVTAIAGSPSLTVAITGKSTLAGAYRTILTSAAITGVSRTILKVYPGLTVAANLTANDILERIWRVEVTAGTTDSVTYSVSANYI